MKLLYCAIYVFVLRGVAGGVDLRIVGGTPATDAQFPYQVSLRDAALGHFCGGSIIATDKILTAARCVYGKTADSIRVVAGTNLLTPVTTYFNVTTVTWHELYNPNTYENNVAVIRVNGNILSIPKTGTVFLNIAATMPGQTCTLTGWGMTSAAGPAYSNDLLYTNLNVLSLNDCKSNYPSTNIDNNLVCTQGGPKGGCHGDNGGPLVSFGIQIGILSWGQPCATGQPDVFTNVASYYNWITSR